MDTQEIQEWEKDWKDIWNYILTYHFTITDYKPNEAEEEIKSFISQKLKEQEKRHKREIELRELALWNLL